MSSSKGLLSRRRNSLLLAFALAGAATLHASSPDWFRQAAQTPVGTYDEKTPGVVLLDEQVTSINPNGEVKTTYRRAVKILRASGKGLGTVSISFDSDTKVSNLHAWSLPAQGKEFEIKEKDAIETNAFNDSLYQDSRIKILRIPGSEPGAVIGYEYEQKHRPDVFQDMWYVQEGLPIIKSRYVINLPPGWEIKTNWRNLAEKQPSISNNQYTWELNDVPAIADEEEMPPQRAVAGRMAVNYYPSSSTNGVSHASWNDIARWYAQVTTGRRATTPAIQQKVKEVTAGKSSDVERIAAIASMMQRDIRYVEISIGIGSYQPHPASDVFSNRFGDCKDKVTLMSTMLADAGIPSYYVLTHSYRGVINESFPTMRSFNHAIIAIRLNSSGSDFSSVVTHSTLGKLLIFDPTDPIAPLGELPASLQGNLGLLVTDDGGALIKLPLTKPDHNLLHRTAKLQIRADGTLAGDVTETRTGTEAEHYRGVLMRTESTKRVKMLETFLASFLTGYSVKSFEVEHLEDYSQPLIIHYSLEAPKYAKNMAGGLLLVRPRVFGDKAGRLLDLKDRHYPVDIDAPTEQTDEFDIELPPGVASEELPPALDLSAAGMSYSSSSKLENNVLHYRREYKVDTLQVPVDKLKDLNSFYARISMDERSSALLKRAP